MYTQCPHCKTIFGIGAAQLRIARAKVRCGQCSQFFDALPGLRDTLPGERATRETADAFIAPTSFIPLATATTSGPVLAAGGPAPPPNDADEEAAQMPDVLRDDLARLDAHRAAARPRRVYTVLSMLLLLGLVGQYAWSMPEDVLRRYPQAHGLLASFCRFTGCELPAPEIPQVRLLSRDVRAHPKYEGAILITATLESAATEVRPYPRMQFTLFNVNGQVIATRRFEAREYLGNEIDIAEGMPTGAPIQIALDLLAPEEAAVSFEFQFL